jgi:hypothetical protein
MKQKKRKTIIHLTAGLLFVTLCIISAYIISIKFIPFLHNIERINYEKLNSNSNIFKKLNIKNEKNKKYYHIDIVIQLTSLSPISSGLLTTTLEPNNQISKKIQLFKIKNKFGISLNGFRDSKRINAEFIMGIDKYKKLQKVMPNLKLKIFSISKPQIYKYITLDNSFVQ